MNDGTGFFTDVTDTTGLPNETTPTRGVVAFDADNDGDLDIFAVNGSQGSGDPPGETNEFYRNDGNMTFTSIETGAHITAPAGQGTTAADFDNDGDVDLFAANKEGDVNILLNDGNANFSLADPALLGIQHTAENGISLADIDNDGDLDLLLEEHLYENLSDGTFQFRRTFVVDGYMGGFADLDNDGDVDLVYAGDDKVYLNDGSGTFVASPVFDPGPIQDPRGVAFADIDDDGDLDFFYAQKRTFNRLMCHE